MADMIRLLPDSVANQIAAGEVIQRPSSVVKELMENAVDAGSTEIRVLVKDAGKSLVQVIDNGCGMSETDARMAFERHATSKISKASDLFSIRTMGFRGEALPSIAAVAQVELKTRRQEEELGTEIIIHGSRLVSQWAVSCPAGSNFSVKNLFFNVPARRKFLKSTSTELRQIIYEFQRIGLSQPGTALELFHNDTEVYRLSSENTRQRILSLFGKGMNQSLIPVDTETSIVNISGFIGKPEFARKTYGEQFLFVNGRFIRHPYLHKAVMQAYEKILPADSYPAYFLFLETDPAHIDINIHPTKTEIKFEDERAVWQLLNAALRESLGRHNIVPSIDFNRENAPEIPVFRPSDQVVKPRIEVNPDYNPFAGKPDNQKPPREWEKLFEVMSRRQDSKQSELDNDIPGKPMESSRNFFQFKTRYILSSVKSGLMIIDQKRAHERILFEAFMGSGSHQQASQKNLFPRTILLNPSDHVILMELLPDLYRLGFDISDLGNHSIVVQGYPSGSDYQDPEKVIEKFIETYKNTGQDPGIGHAERAAQSMAVASAIPYGKELNQEEMEYLVSRLFACSSPQYSPTGKAIIAILSMEELEKLL